MKQEFLINNKKYIFNGETLDFYEVTDEDTTIYKENNESDQRNKNNELRTLFKLVFNISNKCNLKCKYCYAQGGNYGREDSILTKESIDKIMDKLFIKYDRINTVYFFGGEPTLNFENIKYAVDRLSSCYDIKDYRIVTNGTNIDDEMVRYFKEYEFRVYISIDGSEEIHNLLRGKNTHAIILKNIQKFDLFDMEGQLELICTYTKYHKDNGIGYNDLEEYFKKLGIKYSISNVITDDENLKLQHDENYEELQYSEIDNSIKKILEHSDNTGISGILDTVLSTMISKNQNEFFCKELQNDYSNVYDYNEEVYSCIRLLGSYKKDDAKIYEFNNKKNYELCKKCWAKKFCTVCTADLLLFGRDKLVNQKKCDKSEYYKYAMKKVLEIYDEDINKASELFNNYCKYFIK
ncbi:MAG: hypothetical protein A2Y24_06000 [Clostridiales bacterium GWE2_32_10]|nr:MAG: hypothetical protein A2Y24_06000 [Clostridiales bacterium GWE2_32_10]HBY20860.1 hypothetical protein [Clostridiales bacterium]